MQQCCILSFIDGGNLRCQLSPTVDSQSVATYDVTTMSNAVVNTRTYSSSLTKGLRLLSLFTRERPEWGVSELSVKLGTAKSTVSRIARTLEAEGFLTRATGSERFRLGLKLWDLGSQVIAHRTDFPRLTHSHLVKIVDEINESAQAVILDGTEAVYVETVDALRSIRTYATIGHRFPLTCTGTGKALLAFQSDLFIASVLAAKLKAYTRRTVTDPKELMGELQRIRKRGYALNKGEWREDIGGIAAPVFDHSGTVVGAIGVTMPLDRFPREVSSPASAAVVSAAHHLSRELGYLPNHRD